MAFRSALAAEPSLGGRALSSVDRAELSPFSAGFGAELWTFSDTVGEAELSPFNVGFRAELSPFFVGFWAELSPFSVGSGAELSPSSGDFSKWQVFELFVAGGRSRRAVALVRVAFSHQGPSECVERGGPNPLGHVGREKSRIS